MKARSIPNLAIALWTGLVLFGALLLAATNAAGQTSGKTGTARDTTVRVESGDEGFSVRIVEDGKTVEVSKSDARRARDRAAEAVDRAKEAAAAAGRIASQSGGVTPPVPPEPPDLPEPPDFGDSNDLIRFGEDVEIPAGKVVDGDVVALGGSVTVYGRVKGDCVSIGGTVRVKGAGVIEGDAVSLGGGVVTSDSADVKGSNVSIGAWPFRGDGRGAMLPLLGLFGFSAFAGVVFRVVELLVTILFAWLALLLFRERMVRAVDLMGERFGASFLYGLLGWAALLVLVPAGVILMVLVGVLAIVILCITIIGIPVAILAAVALVLGIVALVLAVIAGVFIAYVNGAMFLGRRLLGNRGASLTPLRAAAMGLILMVGLSILGKILGFIGLVFLMPIGIAFGIAAGMLAVVMTTAGLGAMILTRFGKGSGLGSAAGGTGQWWPRSPAAGGPAVTPPPAAPSAAASAAEAPAAPSPPAPPGSTAPREGGTSDAP